MRVTAVVAARNEAGRVGATVRAIRQIEAVDDVVVADGGSDDGTAEEARSAGARVLVGPRRGGKGGSLEGALARIEPADVYLLLDADLGETAGEGRVVLDEVLSGRADLAIGVLPRQAGHGGFRLVKRTAHGLVQALSGFRSEEPLSGQRALSREVMTVARPLAPGFGVEAGMTVDAVRAGFRVAEVPVDMTHAVTGRTIAGFRHRARQGWDLLRAMLRRAVRPR
ncbi:MAG TPA: glycosyltransferase [Actinomycetota bacterium]|nr:glycosyltransferase [Actinomycetota bacterium]